MTGLSANIQRIQLKLQLLLKQYQHLQKENEQLKQQVLDAKTRETNQQRQIEQLEQRVGILQSAVGKMDENDRKVFEKHINQYIREIDKCIGLLSD